MKIILLIFTTVNDISNLAHRLLMAFSELEKRKHKFFWKNYATLSKNPMEPPFKVGFVIRVLLQNSYVVIEKNFFLFN